MISDYERFIPFTENRGEVTQRASEYLRETNRQVNLSTVLTGSGSPEGVLTADPTQLYMDTAGGAGTILYIKQSGTGNTGWILV